MSGLVEYGKPFPDYLTVIVLGVVLDLKGVAGIANVAVGSEE